MKIQEKKAEASMQVLSEVNKVDELERQFCMKKEEARRSRDGEGKNVVKQLLAILLSK